MIDGQQDSSYHQAYYHYYYHPEQYYNPYVGLVDTGSFLSDVLADNTTYVSTCDSGKTNHHITGGCLSFYSCQIFGNIYPSKISRTPWSTLQALVEPLYSGTSVSLNRCSIDMIVTGFSRNDHQKE